MQFIRVGKAAGTSERIHTLSRMCVCVCLATWCSKAMTFNCSTLTQKPFKSCCRITIMRNTAYGCHCFRINSYITTRWYLNAFVFDFRLLWCSCNEKRERERMRKIRINSTMFKENNVQMEWSSRRFGKKTDTAITNKEKKFGADRGNVSEPFRILISEIQMAGQSVCM